MLNRTLNKVGNHSKPNWLRDKPVLIMEKMFLTNGGNLLRFHPTNKFYFQKPNGEFIREVSNSEAEFLCQNCLEVDVHFPHEHPEFLPTWHFVRSILLIDDYSNYRAGTSCNGGDYAFHTHHDWYVSKYPDGSWKFAFVECFSTSAEFSYDELAGSFQSDLGYLCLSNGVDCPSYSSQAGIDRIDGEKVYGVEEVLEKIGTMSCFEDMWNEVYEYIPSRWEDEDEDYSTKPSLSFQGKKEIITCLKELGIEKSHKPKSPRGNRGGGGGERRR